MSCWPELAAVGLLLSMQATGGGAASPTVVEATPLHPLRSLQMGARSDDLHFLDRLVGKARVVSFGEVLHGYQESLLLRNRLFEYLVERHGYTALAAETGFVESTRIDDYVLGRGELTRQLVSDVFTFKAPEAWDENRRLIEWMRAYNSRPGTKRKLRFYGIEMLGHVNYVQAEDRIHNRKAADMALEYVAAVDPDGGTEWVRRFEPLLSQLVAAPYESLPAEQRNSLTAAIADLVSHFERRHVEWIARSSSLRYARAHRSAINARNLDADLRAKGWWTATPRSEADIAQRDAAMAQSVRWVLEREGTGGRVMLFSANGHASRDAGRGEPICLSDDHRSACMHSMGSHLHQDLGRDMVIIAMVDRKVDPPDSRLEALWGLETPQVFAVDFAALPTSGPLRDWWDNLHWHATELNVSLPLVRTFDALVFVDGLSPARTLH